MKIFPEQFPHLRQKLISFDFCSEVSYVSEDRFLEFMSAMPVRKGFYCKKILNTVVHRLTASGLFFKLYKDSVFLIALPSALAYPKEDNGIQSLNLTDVVC